MEYIQQAPAPYTAATICAAPPTDTATYAAQVAYVVAPTGGVHLEPQVEKKQQAPSTYSAPQTASTFSLVTENQRQPQIVEYIQPQVSNCHQPYVRFQPRMLLSISTSHRCKLTLLPLTSPSVMSRSTSSQHHKWSVWQKPTVQHIKQHKCPTWQQPTSNRFFLPLSLRSRSTSS